MQKIEAWMLDLQRPEVFDDGHPDNVVTVQRRAFAELRAALADHGVLQSEQLTVFHLRARADYLEKKVEAQKP
ncbi:hypothetical protein GCM10027048_38960 [Hymenobacter coalescens]